MYTIPIDKTKQAEVGWDFHLGSFFAEVYELDEQGKRIDSFDEHGMQLHGTLLSVGTAGVPITTVKELKHQLKGWVEIPPDVCGYLERDQTNNETPHLAVQNGLFFQSDAREVMVQKLRQAVREAEQSARDNGNPEPTETVFTSDEVTIYENGKPISDLQAIIRHEQLSALLIYV